MNGMAYKKIIVRKVEDMPKNKKQWKLVHGKCLVSCF